MFKNYFLLMVCVSSFVVAAEEVPLSIGVVDEVAALNSEVSMLKSQLSQKIAEDQNLTEELIQKLADEPSLSDSHKSKALKKIRKQIQKAKSQ